MERLLTPLLMKYGRKYFKSWPDIKLSLWGGDVKLSNLEMNTSVLEKELVLPLNIVSATIRELRIHVPWTALTSAPVEVFINSLEIHVATKTETTATLVDDSDEAEDPTPETEPEEDAMDLLGGWLDQILANVALRVENLVVKYQSGDVVLSLSSKLLEVVSSSSHPTWTKQFVDPGPRGVICKSLELSDIVVHLTEMRHTSEQPLLKCDSIQARTLFYMLPKPQSEDQPPQKEDGEDIKPRVDFLIRRPLVINITDAHVELLWRLVGGVVTTPRTPSPVMRRKKEKQKLLLQQKLQQQQQRKQEKQQQKQQQQQQQQQQGWVSWAWGMVVEEEQQEQSTTASITSVSLAEVFATHKISLFVESIVCNFISADSKAPFASLEILALAVQIEASALVPDKQEIYFGLQTIDLKSKLAGPIFVLRSTYVPHTFFPLSLFDPKFFDTTEADSWRHFDALRLKYVQENDSANRSALSGTVGDLEFTFSSALYHKLMEFVRYPQNALQTVISSIVHKAASSASIYAMVEALWSSNSPVIIDISLKKVSVVVPLTESDRPTKLIARLSNLSLSNAGSVPKKEKSGTINWKDYMYNQFSFFIDDFNVCIDQDFIIEPFSVTVQFSTHLITDKALLPFEIPAITVSCSLPRIGVTLTPYQYALLTTVLPNILSLQLPKVVQIADSCKLKIMLQGFNMLYEQNHTYYKVEGGLATLSLIDVTSSSSLSPIGVTVDTICFPSPSRDRRLCSFLIRLPLSKDSAIPRAPSPHCAAINVKFSGFSLAVDSKYILPFLSATPAAPVSDFVGEQPPPLHVSWASFAADGVQLDFQVECLSLFLSHPSDEALYMHLARLHFIGATTPTPTIKARLEGLSVSLIANFRSHFARPHKSSIPTSKILSDVDAELSVNNVISTAVTANGVAVEHDPFAGNTLDIIATVTKPVQLEARKRQLEVIAIVLVGLMTQFGTINSPSSTVAAPPSSIAATNYVTRTFVRLPQLQVKLFVDDTEEFILLMLLNLESSVLQALTASKTFVSINYFAVQSSDFKDLLGPLWKRFGGYLISSPNKKPSEPFLRFEQTITRDAQLLALSTSNIDIVCVLPVVMKLINLTTSLSSHFASDPNAPPASADVVAVPNLILDVGQVQFAIPFPSFPDSVHVYMLKLASIKTSHPTRDTLRLIASQILLESASFETIEDNLIATDEIPTIIAPPTSPIMSAPSSATLVSPFYPQTPPNTGITPAALKLPASLAVPISPSQTTLLTPISAIPVPTRNWATGLVKENILAPLDILVEAQFEGRKTSLNIVIELVSLMIHRQAYQNLLNLIDWCSMYLQPSTPAQVQPTSNNNSEMRVTTILGQVEVAMKSPKSTSVFNLALIMNSVQVNYSVVGDLMVLDNKIGSATIKTSLNDESVSRNLLTPSSTSGNLISVSSVTAQAQSSTTVDIQPLSLSLHEHDLRELVEFFRKDAQPTTLPAVEVTATTIVEYKTKVIVENLELNLVTGSQEADDQNGVVLRARQLFFASQPFKAGATEGTQFDLTIVDLKGGIVKATELFHVLGPATAQISMLSTIPTFSLAIDIPLLPGHVNVPHINNVVDVYTKIAGVFIEPGSVSEEPVEEDVITWTNNDLRLGQLKFVEERDIRPYSGEISFSRDDATQPWMSWRYSMPRALGRISMLTPSVGAIKNERGYKCMLSYWDELLQVFTDITQFTISDNAAPITLPQPIYASEFRVTVMSSTSGISSPTTLAVRLSIDSFSSPSRVPSFTCDVACAVADLSIMRPIYGSREELYQLKLDRSVYRMTSWAKIGAMKIFTTSNLALDYHEYRNMNFAPLIEPFGIKLTMDKQIRPPDHLSSPLSSSSSGITLLPLSNRPIDVWNVGLHSDPIEINVSADSVSHITKSIWEFQQPSDPVPQYQPSYFRYTFTNMTNEDLYFGQAATDEGIFLPSKKRVLYSWRSKTDTNLVDIWVAGSQRFGKPLSIQNTGLTKCRITYKGWDVSSWILVEVKDMHSTVTIFGTHKLTNWLPFPVEVKIDLFPNQVQTLATESSCGFFCPDNSVSHVTLSLGPEWKWSVPLPLVQNLPVLVEISPEDEHTTTKSAIHMWFQVAKNEEGGCLVSFWPIFFFKNRSSQLLEFSASVPQESLVVTGKVPASTGFATGESGTKPKSGNLMPVPFGMSPRKNPGFCFRIASAENTQWSDPPIVVGPRSLPEGISPLFYITCSLTHDLNFRSYKLVNVVTYLISTILEGRSSENRNLEISQHLITMNGNEYARMNVKVKAMHRSPSICLFFSFPSELRNESDCLIYFSPRVTKGSEKSPLVIQVLPGQSIPFDHNMRSNNQDFSRIWIGVKHPITSQSEEENILWTTRPFSTGTKAQISDVSLICEDGDKSRLFKFVCFVESQKHSSRICIRPRFVIANQTGIPLTLYCGTDSVTLTDKGKSTHLLSWETSNKKYLECPVLRLSTPQNPEIPVITSLISGNVDATQNVSQARVAIPAQRDLITYATSYSELTGVSTIVLFHDTHPPVVLCNELDIPLMYEFKVDPKKGRKSSLSGSVENFPNAGKILEPGVQQEDAWDYEGFSEANEKTAAARLIPPPLLVRTVDSDALGVDIVHDFYAPLVFSTSTNPSGTQIWVTVEVKGCTRFVYFRQTEGAFTTNETPNSEWHISASIAEIGLSLLEHAYDTTSIVVPATANGNINAKIEDVKGKEKEKEVIKDTSGILRESLHVSLAGVQVRTETFGNEVSAVACADIVQVDNQISEFEFPVVLAPLRDLSKTNAQIQPTVDIFLKMTTGTHKHLKDAAISMKPMVLNLEDRHLMYVSALAANVVSAIYVHPTIQSGVLEQKEKIRFATTQEFLAEITEAPFYIAKLRINTISLHLTLHATVGIFLGIQHTHIPLPAVSLDKILATQRSLVEYLLAQYMAAGVLRGAAAVLSLELLGNPGGLIHEIWAGVRDALTLPLTGLARGSPTEFVDGLRGGTLSLVRHISHGTLGSVHVLSDALSRNLLQISMDSGLLANNWEAHQDRAGIRHGVTKGLKSFGYGIWSGLTGIVTEPVKGYMSEDSGIVIGVGKGLVGAFTKPILGFTELVAHTTGGILHTTSLSYLPARRRAAKPAMLTLASWTKLRLQFVAKEEELVTHVVGAFITTSRRYPQCILLVTTKRLIIIDATSEEACRTIQIDSIKYIEDESNNQEKTTVLHTPDALINVHIPNASKKLGFIQAIRNTITKK